MRRRLASFPDFELEVSALTTPVGEWWEFTVEKHGCVAFLLAFGELEIRFGELLEGQPPWGKTRVRARQPHIVTAPGKYFARATRMTVGIQGVQGGPE